MLIEIHLTGRQPPAGHVIRADRRRTDFEGWLALLRVLAEEIAPVPQAPPGSSAPIVQPRHDGRELDP